MTFNKEKIHNISFTAFSLFLIAGTIIFRDVYFDAILADLSYALCYLSLIIYALTDENPKRKILTFLIIGAAAVCLSWFLKAMQ